MAPSLDPNQLNYTLTQYHLYTHSVSTGVLYCMRWMKSSSLLLVSTSACHAKRTVSAQNNRVSYELHLSTSHWLSSSLLIRVQVCVDDDLMLRPQVWVSRSVTTGRVPAEAGCEGPGQLHPARCVGAQRRQPRRPLRRLSQPQRRRQSECHGANSEDPFPYFGGVSYNRWTY